MSSFPHAAKVAAAAGLEKAIEQVFKLDPSLASKLAHLEDKVIQFSIDGPNVDLYFMPSQNGIAVMSQYEGKVTCQVKGKPSDFVDLLLADDMPSALINGDITVTGDTSSLMSLQDVFKTLDLDWEYELSRVVGDVAAHEIGKAVNAGLAFVQNHSKDLTSVVSRSIQNEAGLLADKQNIQRFCDDVDSLAARVDRLAAKISRRPKD